MTETEKTITENINTKEKRTDYKSIIYIIAAGLLWSTMSIFTRRFTAMGFTEFEIMSTRAYISAILLLIYNLLRNRDGLKLKRIIDLKYFAAAGLVGIIFFSWAYMKSINLSSTSVAATLLYTAPAIVMIFSVIFFGEKFTGRKLLVLLMTFIGCLLVTGLLEDGGNVSAAGILFGLGAGFGYAMYTVFTAFAIKKYNSTTITFFTFLISSVFLMPFSISVITKIFENGMLMFSVIFALVTTVLPFTLYTNGLAKVEASKASLMAAVEPVSAALIGIFLFNESASIMKIAGIALVAVSVTMAGRE
ncbi:MAG: EamA family transporter [Clostridia bacterium]|nr:EamA family transporter [Clostridia bacterium]